MKLRRYALALMVVPTIVWACGDDDDNTDAVITPDAGTSSSGGSGTSGGSSGSGTGASSGDSAPACTAATSTTKIQPINLGFLIDQSSSMADAFGSGSTRWKSTVTAVKAFAGATTSDGVNAALTFFDATDACSVASYTTPSVPFSALPAKAADLGTELDKRSPSGNSSTQPALTGALQSTTVQAAAHADQSTVVVLITDGEPSNNCPGGMNTSEGVKAAAAAGGPVPTYVLSLVSDDKVKEYATGGVTSAFVATSPTEIGAALTAIQNQLKCLLPLPIPTGVTFDPSRTTVTLPSSTTELPFGDCASATAPGWFLDKHQAAPRLGLCPASCKDLGTGDVTVKFACP